MRLAQLITTGLLLAACGGPPEEAPWIVDYRDGSDGGPVSGERGTIKISEILWSGSVRDDGTWDPSDVFIELRNESMRPVSLTNWQLLLEGSREITWLIPDIGRRVGVGEQVHFAAKTSGCFPEADGVIEGLSFPTADPFRVTLRDADKRLIEPAGHRTHPPMAGGYDLAASRSMERIHIMFGGRGDMSESWKYYYRRACSEVDRRNLGEGSDDLNCFDGVPNNDKVAVGCRKHTLASPGRMNSEDYTGAYASGGFE